MGSMSSVSTCTVRVRVRVRVGLGVRVRVRRRVGVRVRVRVRIHVLGEHLHGAPVLGREYEPKGLPVAQRGEANAERALGVLHLDVEGRLEPYVHTRRALPHFERDSRLWRDVRAALHGHVPG